MTPLEKIKGGKIRGMVPDDKGDPAGIIIENNNRVYVLKFTKTMSLDFMMR